MITICYIESESQRNYYSNHRQYYHLKYQTDSTNKFLIMICVINLELFITCQDSIQHNRHNILIMVSVKHSSIMIILFFIAIIT